MDPAGCFLQTGVAHGADFCCLRSHLALNRWRLCLLSPHSCLRGRQGSEWVVFWLGLEPSLWSFYLASKLCRRPGQSWLNLPYVYWPYQSDLTFWIWGPQANSFSLTDCVKCWEWTSPPWLRFISSAWGGSGDSVTQMAASLCWGSGRQHVLVCGGPELLSKLTPGVPGCGHHLCWAL